MQLCNNDHEEVAFAGASHRDCPACNRLAEVREELEDRIKELDEEVDNLSYEISNHECG